MSPIQTQTGARWGCYRLCDVGRGGAKRGFRASGTGESRAYGFREVGGDSGFRFRELGFKRSRV